MIGIFDSLKKMFRDNGPALIVYCVTSLLLMSMLLLPVLKIVEIGTSVEWKFSEHFFHVPNCWFGCLNLHAMDNIHFLCISFSVWLYHGNAWAG